MIACRAAVERICAGLEAAAIHDGSAGDGGTVAIKAAVLDIIRLHECAGDLPFKTAVINVYLLPCRAGQEVT
jgi:hypothetical protein